jgi:hypothetical protein
MSLSNACVQIGDLLADVADHCVVVAGGFSKFHHGYGDMCGELGNVGSSCGELIKCGGDVLEEIAKFP